MIGVGRVYLRNCRVCGGCFRVRAYSRPNTSILCPLCNQNGVCYFDFLGWVFPPEELFPDYEELSERFIFVEDEEVVGGDEDWSTNLA